VNSQRGIRLGSVLGAPVLLMPSWFLIAALVTYFYAPAVERQAPELGAAVYPVAFCAALLLLLSVFLHEVAHAIAARSVGTPPSHIALDLWGGHTAFDKDMSTPGHSALVSLVGPATNAALAVLGLLAAPAVPAGGVGEVLLNGAVYANAFVAVFNALPGLPLDGGRALEALIWKVTGNRAAGTITAGWVGRAVAVTLVAWAVLLPLLRGRPVSLTSVVWLGLIALMLWQGAGQAIQAGRWTHRAPTVSAATLMKPAVAVQNGATLGQALAAASAGGVQEVVLVAADGRPVAVLDAGAIRAVPPERVGTTTAGAVARVLPPHALVPAALLGNALLAHLQANPSQEYAVLDEAGGLTGVLRWADVVAGASGRSE
jgi:Zn-dependent protease